MSIIAQLPEALREVEWFEEGWRRKPVLREVYGEYYELIARWRSNAPGRNVELGSGRADYRQHNPGTLCCDVMPFPWLDFSADATRLPLGCGSVANLKIEQVIKPLLPMFIVMFIVLMLVTYIPSLSLWLPSLLMK